MSFERVGDGLDQARLQTLARRLRAAGIQPQSVEDDTVLLVRSQDAAQAAEIAATLTSE